MIERSWVRITPGAAGEFSSPGSAFCADSYFWYPFHPHVTAVARKRSRSFCQKCRWQVTAKQVYTLRMWPYVCALHEVTWCMVVWCTQNLRRDGSSFMWHPPCQRCKYTTSVYIQKRAVKKASHSCRITCERSESARERRIALFKSERNHQLCIDIPTGFQRPSFFLFFKFNVFLIYASSQ